MTAKRVRTVTLEPSGVTFTAAPGQRLLEAARDAGAWLPFECGWGSCSSCKTTLVSGLVESLLPDAPAISDRDARRGRILLCQSSALTDVILRPLRVDDSAPAGRHTRRLAGRVECLTKVGPSLFELRINVGSPLDFRAGQFAILENGDGLRRCYSLAGTAGESTARFVFKCYEGRPMSTWLSTCLVGDSLTVEVPYGDVWLRPGQRGMLMIAGGTGISAIISLVREAATSHRTRELTVLYGARSAAELALLTELRGLVDAHGSARLVAMAEEGPTEAPVESGRVTDVLAQLTVNDHDVYLAGPPAMVDAVDILLEERGVQRDRLFVDRFG